MTGTLCRKHFEPVLKEGPEPEIKAIWPASPCVICGALPGEYIPGAFVCVTDDTIERAKRIESQSRKE